MEINPPLPEGAAEQLERISRSFGAQASSGYEDIEDFFDRRAETFSTTERFWREVSATKKQIEAFAEQPIIPGEAHIDDQGVVRASMRLADGENRNTRRLAHERSLPVRHMMARINQATHARLMALIDRGLLTVFRGDDYNLGELAESNIRIRKETQASLREPDEVPKHRIVSEGSLTDELGTMAAALEEAYEGAFLGQYIGIHEIQTLLADDRHVMPFVNRLQELAALSRGGWVEFPGLLETVQVHLVESRIKRQPDSIQVALRRVAGELYSRHVFMHSLVNPEAAPEIPIAKPPDTFLGGVATARAISAILGRNKDAGITAQEVAEHIADNLDTMPADWQAAYETAKEGVVMSVWGSLGTVLRPFERSGRLVSNIDVKGGSEAQAPPASASKRRRGGQKPQAGKKTGAKTRVADRNLGDIITQAEAEPEVAPPTFAVLKGTGSATRKVYNIDHVGDLEEAMETSVVKGFLRGRTGLTDDVRAMLRTIMEDPLGTSKTLEVRKNFRINGDGVPDVAHPLRRYSPRKGNIEGGTSHELASQVRIFFATTTIDGKKCIALENIDLRDSHTY